MYYDGPAASRFPEATLYNINKQRASKNPNNHDPYRCLRCSSIAIGIWNILYCLIQFGLLGWQIGVVKEWQWYWENRELPATGAIDQYQARFPGLYAIYTETPERRRVDAMYAIVLICMVLTIVHLVFSIAMLYGSVKGHPSWILPWFFTSLPLILLCTAYSVLWWSGDIFNEQLTFSVTEFAMSLAVNGVCFVVVVLYYLRLRGKLTSERINGGHLIGAIVEQKPSTIARSPTRGKPTPRGDESKLPPWVEPFPDKAPPNIARKLRRKERREGQMKQRVEREKQKNHKQQARRARPTAPQGILTAPSSGRHRGDLPIQYGPVPVQYSFSNPVQTETPPPNAFNQHRFHNNAV